MGMIIGLTETRPLLESLNLELGLLSCQTEMRRN